MPSTVKKFKELKLNPQLLKAVEDQGFDVPTPVQVRAIPLILAGHDVMGIAPTGTGKTAAYVLPLLIKVKYAQGNQPRALILAPSKELVLQINENIAEFSKYTDLRSVALYGGVGPTQQIDALRSGQDIVVATPGRFLDLYLKGEFPVKSLQTLVLDEADKMMDMGFMPQIRKVLEVIPVKRQNLLFSATMMPKVMTLSEEFLEFPEVVEVAPQATAADTIKQELYYVPNMLTKIHFLTYLLQYKAFKKVMIFTKTRKNADNIYKFLLRKDIGEIRIVHSNKSQNTRINSINAFKQGEIRILVSTDVSSRGLDISNVSHVINFDVPVVHEDYVHRIGRTGRALRPGKSITFVNDVEKYHISKIEKLIREKIQVIRLPQDIKIFETSFEERQEMAREYDKQRKMEDPEFKGAFHEKKKRVHKSFPYTKTRKKRRK